MRLFSQKKLVIGDCIKTLKIRPGNKKTWLSRCRRCFMKTVNYVFRLYIMLHFVSVMRHFYVVEHVKLKLSAFYQDNDALVSKIIRIFTVVFFRIVVLECLIQQNEIQKERTFGLKTLSPPIATSTCASSRKKMKKSCLQPNCLPTISRSARHLTMRQTRL